MVVIEMNPRVSRSSALASKATGFPIAKIAARLAVGYRLDEIPNDITRMTPACFEPTIDYVVTKIPRFAFEKFRGAADELGPQMKSVGEAMAIGRTFKESLQKALRSLEIGSWGLESRAAGMRERGRARRPSARASVAAQQPSPLLPRRRGAPGRRARGNPSADRDRSMVYRRDRRNRRGRERESRRDPLDAALLRELKESGFSDRRIAELRGARRSRRSLKRRREAGVTPVFKAVDTCGAEFQAFTPYLYSTYEGEDEAPPDDRRKMMILGGGPNRIGQGIEFDYCCVHASLALKEAGFETIMVNCNPETVSTDYDISDRLYFEPLTFEDVMAIVEREKPGRRDRAVRRADAAEARGAAGARRRADSRHFARRDRSRGGSRALQRSWSRSSGSGSRAACWRAASTQAVRGAARSRLPGADSALLRARRTRDGSIRGRSGAAPLRRAGAARLRASVRCWSTATSRARLKSTSTRSPTARRWSSAA